MLINTLNSQFFHCDRNTKQLILKYVKKNIKKFIILFMILQFSAHAGSMNMIGQKGKASEVDRVINVKMYDIVRAIKHQN